MSTEIYLVRHGNVEYDYGADAKPLVYDENTPLSSSGRAQIEEAANFFLQEQIHIDSIYTSPLTRTFESAQILSRRLGCRNIIENDDLKEVRAPGWAGSSLEEIRKLKGDIYSKPKSDDQETLDSMRSRMLRVFERVRRFEEGRRVIVVSHEHPLQVLNYALFHPEILSFKKYHDIVENGFIERGAVWRVYWDEIGAIRKSKLVNGAN